jgi:hypothetical protein
VELVWEIDIGSKAAATPDQRPIFKPSNRRTDRAV